LKKIIEVGKICGSFAWKWWVLLLVLLRPLLSKFVMLLVFMFTFYLILNCWYARRLTLSLGLSFNSASTHSSVLMSLPPSTTVTHRCMHTKDVITTSTINNYNSEEFVFYSTREYHTNQNGSLLPPERMYSLLCLALRESIALRASYALKWLS
jgi:hypothetical protein